jgi:spermidine synthase
LNSLGRHVLAEFSGCSSEALNDLALVESAMVNAAKVAGATVLQSAFHHFSPFGVSGVVVIEESHLAIHTWPEYRYAAVDLFTCGESVDPWISFDRLKRAFEATNHSALEIHRGSTAMLQRVELAPLALRAARATQGDVRSQRSAWFTDRDEGLALSLRHSGSTLFDETSAHQRVRVLESESHGRVLAINEMVLCTERDEAHYHEMMVHPALQAFSEARRALIIGGGDGGAARELFRYPNVEHVTLVEIDETVVRASRAHLPSLARELANPKLAMVIADGVEFVRSAAAESFDVVLVDGSDPAGPGLGLFTESFYRDCHRVLARRGVLVAQGESPAFHARAFTELHACLGRVFEGAVQCMLFYATSYPTGMWSMQTATKGGVDVTRFDEPLARAFCKAEGLRYYNPEVHRAAFALPTFVRELLAQNGT